MDSVLSTGLSCRCVLLIYSPGSNIGNQVYAWNVPEDIEPCLIFERSQSVVEVKANLLIYHSRAMRAAMFAKFGRVSYAVKPAILRYFYKDLTGKHNNTLISVHVLCSYSRDPTKKILSMGVCTPTLVFFIIYCYQEYSK